MSGINFEASSQSQATGMIESSGPVGGNHLRATVPLFRKPQPKWTGHVRICKQKGLQVSLDDGYNWKKYGQKDILRAKHPRSYYRCSRSSAEGCKAMKHVQQSDEERSMFIVTYQGKHTCLRDAHLVAV
ncbi:hypothetical protein C5167_048022 [Papaver somniferum]|uniref:WRKY domain-containing protein n=1 Tax=Papaver somniferum TaxID=3469 RepID=A0A4Y7KKW9_PAPSO|nr:hypothetical protein C5167_048022 [Papaver somniferum]